MSLTLPMSSSASGSGSGPLPAGHKLFGYEIVSHIGEGAASSVYVASKPGEGQLYALKHVVRKDEKSDRFIEQLSNEFQVSQRINHPSVRRCVEFKTAKTLLSRAITEAALILELVDASPLDRLMNEDLGMLPLDQTIDILAETAKGMAAVKMAGFVHCDMKPGNIMITEGADHHIVKVIDLGQACVPGTKKARVQGSPHFISPEQYRLEPITFRTDVYNFGATAYWALTGHNIPTYFTRAKGLAKGSAEEAPKVHERRPEVPEGLGELIYSCYRSKVMDRPDSMVTVAKALEAFRKGVGRDAA